MPTILDPGSVRLSNADVLDWIKRKRGQHKDEAIEDKAAGRKKVFMSDNYQRALRKHERELSARKYPYTDNPGAYSEENRFKSMAIFTEKLDEGILDPLEAKYREDLITPKSELAKRMQREQEMKGLTETEHFQIFNLAPQCVETLQNIVVDWEERFTAEEMEALLATINNVYRCGDRLPGAVDGMDVDDKPHTNGIKASNGEDHDLVAAR